MRQWIIQPRSVKIILIAQFLPLVLFPPASFLPSTQEWWLPVMLAVLAGVAVFQLIGRRSVALWPWYLVSFAQGFNIISRLMMLMPHATLDVSGVQTLNVAYLVLSGLSLLLSAFMLWYIELPEVRLSLLPS